MAKYIVLMNWTEQGVKTVKESPARLDAARKSAAASGITSDQFFMVMGDHDLVSIMDAPGDEALAIFLLKLAAGGNLRTKTLKAFTEDQYRGVMAGL